MPPDRSRVGRLYARLLRRRHPEIDETTAAEAAGVFAARRQAAWRHSTRRWLGVWWTEVRALAARGVPGPGSTHTRAGELHPVGFPASRQGRVGRAIDHLARDTRYAARQLMRAPTFTGVAVGSVAVGLVGVLLVFAAANATLWRPLPGVLQPDRLVALFYGSSSDVWSYPDFEDAVGTWAAIEDAAALATSPIVVATREGTRREVLGQRVSGRYFDVLRVPMVVGRPFTDDDPREVAVISARLWERDYHATADILGRQIDVRGRQHTIVGVAPKGLLAFTAPVEPQVYYPIPDDQRRERGWRSLDVIGRMRDGETVESVRAQADAASRRVYDADPAPYRADNGEPLAIRVEAGARARISPNDRGEVLGVMSGAIAIMTLILLVATTNLANMVLTRGLQKRHELGMRRALGAGRGRLVTQLLIESLLVAAMAGALALGAVHLITSWAASGQIFAAVPAAIDFRPDARVIAFALSLSTIAGLGIGLMPALHVTGSRFAATVKASAPTGSRGQSRLRFALVTLQLAGSLVLVVSAMLFARSLAQAHQVDLGFEPDGVSVMTIDLGERQYSDEAAARFFDEAAQRLETIPGIGALAFARTVPLSGTRSRDVGFSVEGYEPEPDELTMASTNLVSPGYFSLMGIRLLAGREFTADDRTGALPVTIVDQTFVDTYWPGVNPIGRRVAERTVVGVVAPSKASSLAEEPFPFMWLPVAQTQSGRLAAHVRPTGDPARVRKAMERVVRELDAALLVQAMPMSDAMGNALFLPRLLSATFASAGLLALGLATLGVYGVMSYVVGMRAREMGIRLALGATRSQLMQLVMREGVSLSAVGFGIGLALAVAAALVMQSLLVGVTPLDPIALATGLLLLAMAAGIACYLPARRASRVDPVASLRTE